VDILYAWAGCHLTPTSFSSNCCLKTPVVAGGPCYIALAWTAQKTPLQQLLPCCVLHSHYLGMAASLASQFLLWANMPQYVLILKFLLYIYNRFYFLLGNAHMQQYHTSVLSVLYSLLFSFSYHWSIIMKWIASKWWITYSFIEPLIYKLLVVKDQKLLYWLSFAYLIPKICSFRNLLLLIKTNYNIIFSATYMLRETLTTLLLPHTLSCLLWWHDITNGVSYNKYLDYTSITSVV
jgi:hypothetical protein